MARYSVSDQGTNTAGDTMLYFVNGATSPGRLRLYDILIGSDATPADQACDYRIRLVTNENVTPGGDAITPQPLDAEDRGVLSNAEGFTITGEPTGTADLLIIALNQRATFRWVAAPGSELICDAAEDNGFAIFPESVTSAFACNLTMLYVE